MSGQDEKIGIIEAAKKGYRDLMEILRRENPKDPYSLLPPRLKEAIRLYEKFGAVNNAMNFRDALRIYWREIDVIPESEQELEKIANISIFDDGSWGPDPERYR